MITVNDDQKISSDKLILDTGGGLQGTIASRSWFVFEKSGVQTRLEGYQSKRERLCPVVNAITKVLLEDNREVLFIMNNASLVEDDRESESLAVPFDMMRHGVSVDVTPCMYGGKQGITVDSQFLRCNYDQEKVFYFIQKPTQQDLDTFQEYEITSPNIYNINMNKEIRRNKKEVIFNGISIEEWKKRLALAPEEIVRKTLEATTQFYTSVEVENRKDPRRHMQSRFPGLRNNRIQEQFATDTFYPSEITDQGHTCSQIFVGKDSDRWEVYPLKHEHNNISALEDFTREVGVPNVLCSDNAKSESLGGWKKHCRKHCIDSRFSDPHHPWKNPVKKE